MGLSLAASGPPAPVDAPVDGDRYVAMLPALVFVLLILSWIIGLYIGLLLPDTATLRLMVKRWRLSSMPIRLLSNELRRDISGVVLLEDDVQGESVPTRMHCDNQFTLICSVPETTPAPCMCWKQHILLATLMPPVLP
jgi:hypothetical protein